MPFSSVSLQSNGEGLVLEGKQLPNACFSQVKYVIQEVAPIGFTLGCALDFYKLAITCHHNVKVRTGGSVLGVAEVQQQLACHQAQARSRNGRSKSTLWRFSLGFHPAQGQGQGHVCTCDGGGTCTTVSLDYITIEDNHAFPELLQIHRSAKAAANQAPDLLRTPAQT
jgi:hypothetical protein